MIKPNIEKVKNMYTDSSFLFQFIGDKYNLNFYSNNDNPLGKVYNKLEIDAQAVGKEYYVAINEELFNKTLKDNDSALLELEKVLSFNRGIAGYFLYGFSYLFILWFFNFYPSFLTGYVLYGLPFWLQVIGMIVIYVGILGLPLWLMYRLRNSRVKTVWFSSLMLYHLKDKTFRTAFKEIREEDKKPNEKWWNKRIIPSKLSPFHNLGRKVSIIYSLAILFFVGIIASFYMTMDVPLSYLPTLFNEIMDFDFTNTKVIKTKYTFTERTDAMAVEEYVNSCGEYYCEYFGDFILDGNFNQIDLTTYFSEDEDISNIIFYNDGIAVVKFDMEDWEHQEYKVIDIENEEVLYIINEGFLNIDVEFFTALDGFYEEGFVYLSGTEHRTETEKIGSLYKINETGIVDVYYSNNGTLIYELEVNGDSIYLAELSEENTDNTIVKELNFAFNVLQERILEESRFYNMYNVDGNIVIYDGMAMYDYYVVNEDLTLDFKYTRITDAYWISHFDDRLTTGFTLKSYTEFDKDFNVITEGLDCETCTDEEYFNDYYFIRKDDKVYAIDEDYTLVFTETDGVSYSLSRSSLTVIGFITYVSVFMIPVTISHIILYRREKETKKVEKHIKELSILNK